MPSWNIHTAHVERLLREEGAAALGVIDVNAFLFGNFVPDVYVGYMVPDPSFRIDYKLTHLALREHIPLPRYDDFWRFYVARQDAVTDLVRGAWAHLVADHVYNAHTRAYLASIGVKPGERARVGKQADFALFGRTLDISMVPHVDDALLAQCADFPMYSVAEKDVRAAADVARGIVEKNRAEHVTGEPEYQLLTAEFFETARKEAHDTIVAGLKTLCPNCHPNLPALMSAGKKCGRFCLFHSSSAMCFPHYARKCGYRVRACPHLVPALMSAGGHSASGEKCARFRSKRGPARSGGRNLAGQGRGTSKVSATCRAS